MTGHVGTVGFTKQEEGSQFSPGSNAWKVWKSQSQVPQFPRQPCHGECSKAQRRERQRFPTPISWEGGDTHIAFPPGHCTFTTNTMPGPATLRGLCVLSGGAPRVQRLSMAMAQAATTHSPPSPAPKAHHRTVQGPRATCGLQMGLDLPFPQRGRAPWAGRHPHPDQAPELDSAPAAYLKLLEQKDCVFPKPLGSLRVAGVPPQYSLRS